MLSKSNMKVVPPETHPNILVNAGSDSLQHHLDSLPGSHPPPPSRLAVLFDISQLLETGLDRESLDILVGLTESGVNPEALAAVVKELRRESAALHAAEANAAQPGAEPPR